MKVQRVKRNRRIDTPDPWLLACWDLVLTGKAQNPYKPGSVGHAQYEQGIVDARKSVPADWAPEWPRKNKPRKATG